MSSVPKSYLHWDLAASLLKSMGLGRIQILPCGSGLVIGEAMKKWWHETSVAMELLLGGPGKFRGPIGIMPWEVPAMGESTCGLLGDSPGWAGFWVMQERFLDDSSPAIRVCPVEVLASWRRGSFLHNTCITACSCLWEWVVTSPHEVKVAC